MSNSEFKPIPAALAEAFVADPNKYLPEFEFRESKGVRWKSPMHLRYTSDGTFGSRSSDGNGSNILQDSEEYPSRRYVVFDGGDGGHKTFIAIYAAIHDVDEDEALEKAFEIYGISRNEDPEIAERRRLKKALQEEFGKITEAAQRALKDEAPDQAKKYALNRFTAREGLDAKVGYVSAEVQAMIVEFSRKCLQKFGVGAKMNANAILGRICAPIVMLGKTYGYICRAVEGVAPSDEKRPKYSNVVFYGAGKKPVYGLERVQRVGVLKKPNLVLVEGEFACMKVRALTGLQNIAAIGQASVTGYQASVIRRAGYESVTLWLDNDGFGKRENNLKALESSVIVLYAAGLRVNAIRVEHNEDGKFAPDDEAMKDALAAKEEIENASPAVFAICNLLSEIYNASPNVSADDKRAFIDGCIEAIAEYTFDDIERAYAVKRFVEANGEDLGLREMQVKAEISRIKGRAAATREESRDKARKEEAARLYQSAAEEMSLGYYVEARKKVALANAMLDERESSDFVRLLPPQNVEEMFEDTRVGEAIKMPFVLTKDGSVPTDADEYEACRYVLTAGGLDLVSALTSHGKTRVLENLALNCIYEFERKKKERQVLFFTAEEVRPSIVSHFMSIVAGDAFRGADGYLGRCLSRPVDDIQKILLSGNFDCVHGDKYNGISEGKAVEMIKGSIGRVTKYIKGAKLSVFSVSTIEEIEKLTMMSEERMQVSIGAIFIDYVQIIKSRMVAAADDKKREITNVLERAMDLAKATGAAVVVGSQLNRGNFSPLTMDCQNNALASDIEQIAFSDMLMWNSSGRLKEGVAWDNSDADVKGLRAAGFEIGQEGKIYVRLGKNRRGSRNVWGVLDFDAPSGYIGGNAKRE